MKQKTIGLSLYNQPPAYVSMDGRSRVVSIDICAGHSATLTQDEAWKLINTLTEMIGEQE